MASTAHPAPGGSQGRPSHRWVSVSCLPSSSAVEGSGQPGSPSYLASDSAAPLGAASGSLSCGPFLWISSHSTWRGSGPCPGEAPLQTCLVCGDSWPYPLQVWRLAPGGARSQPQDWRLLPKRHLEFSHWPTPHSSC